MAQERVVESVWDYPRPPRLERVAERLEVRQGGAVLAATERGWRVLETSHPPVYYFPPEDVRMERLRQVARQSFCEFKGVATYWAPAAPTAEAGQPVAWSYGQPTAAFLPLRDHLAFYASRVDECWVGGERVTPQPGDFYGGWITSWVRGPFKGGPGTMGW